MAKAKAKEETTSTVSMTFKKPWRRYSQGDRAGFPAEMAKELEDRKIAVPTASVKKPGAGSDTGKQTGSDQNKGTEGADKV